MRWPSGDDPGADRHPAWRQGKRFLVGMQPTMIDAAPAFTRL
jgi:hypothetical protein